MLVDENKSFLISSFCSSTSLYIAALLPVSLETGCKPPIGVERMPAYESFHGIHKGGKIIESTLPASLR